MSDTGTTTTTTPAVVPPHEIVDTRDTGKETWMRIFRLVDYPPIPALGCYSKPLFRPDTVGITWTRHRTGDTWEPWHYHMGVHGPNVKQDGTDGQRRHDLGYAADRDPRFRWAVDETRPTVGDTAGSEW